MTEVVCKARELGDITGLIEMYRCLRDRDQTTLTQDEVIDIAFDPELTPEVAAESILDLESSSGVSNDGYNERGDDTQQITEIANAIRQFQRTGDSVILCTTIRSACDGLDASNEITLQHATNPEQDPYDSAELIWINAKENTVDDYDHRPEPVKQSGKQTIKFRNIKPKPTIEDSPGIVDGHSPKTYRLISEDPSRQPIYERDIRKEHVEESRTTKDEQFATEENGILSQPQHPVQIIPAQKSFTDHATNPPVGDKAAMPPPTTLTNTLWGINMPTQRATRLAQDFGLDPKAYQPDRRARSVSPRRITKRQHLENDSQSSPSGSRRSRSTNGTGMHCGERAELVRCPINLITKASSPTRSGRETVSQVASSAGGAIREAHRAKAISEERAVKMQPDYPVYTPGASATYHSWPSLPKHWSDSATVAGLQDKGLKTDPPSEDACPLGSVLDSPRPLNGDRKRIPSMSYESSPSKRIKPLVAGKVCQDPISRAWLSIPIVQSRSSEDTWKSKASITSLLGYIEELPLSKVAFESKSLLCELLDSKITSEQGSRSIGQQHKVVAAPTRKSYYETRGPVGYRKDIVFSVSKLLMPVF